MPQVLVPVSALTITRTSFGSVTRDATANPSPSAKAQNPVVSPTTALHSQNDFETPHSDNASPKNFPSQAFQAAPNPPPSSAPISTQVFKPQSASPKQSSVQHKDNAPGNFDSKFLSSLEFNSSDNLGSDSPSSTPIIPVQLEFNGPNSDNMDSLIGDSTVLLASLRPSSPPRLTLGNNIITANSISQFVINRQTLLPGGPEITVSGTPISLDRSATHVVVAGDTIMLSKSPSLLFTLPGSVVTPNSESQYLIGGQTLIPGSSIYVSGTLISLAPSASEVVIGSSTLGLLSSSPLSLSLLTIGDQIIAANTASQYNIDGQTLAAGSPAITVSGTPMSLAPSASNLVIDGITIPFATAPNPLQPLTFGGETIFPNSASEYVIGSQKVAPGAPAVTISGTPISLAPSASNIIIGGVTIALISSATPLPPLTIDGK